MLCLPAAIQFFIRMTCLLILLLTFQRLSAQQRFISGSVADPFTKEKIPYVSLQWKNAGFGTVTDSVGNFKIPASCSGSDTVFVSYVGFEFKSVPLSSIKECAAVVI